MALRPHGDTPSPKGPLAHPPPGGTILQLTSSPTATSNLTVKRLINQFEALSSTPCGPFQSHLLKFPITSPTCATGVSMNMLTQENISAHESLMFLDPVGSSDHGNIKDSGRTLPRCSFGKKNVDSTFFFCCENHHYWPLLRPMIFLTVILRRIHLCYINISLVQVPHLHGYLLRFPTTPRFQQC